MITKSSLTSWRGNPTFPPRSPRTTPPARKRTQDLVRASAQAGRVGQLSGRAAAGLRNLLVYVIPDAAYVRISAKSLGWSPP